jgi:hypothetical protein
MELMPATAMSDAFPENGSAAVALPPPPPATGEMLAAPLADDDATGPE